MKILLTNDDGIEAEGLRALAKWAKEKGEVTVVAPKREQSAKSHAIEIVHPVEIRKVDLMEGVCAYAMDSTPADCVRFGVVGLKKEYDLVLSGINNGVNLGIDVVYSGTIGAVFEAVRYGLPSIALSAEKGDMDEVIRCLDKILGYLQGRNLFQETLAYNVNVPQKAKGMKMVYEGSRYYSDDFVKLDGDMYLQIGEIVPDESPLDEDRDTVAYEKGFITIMPLMTMRTNMGVFKKYQGEKGKVLL